MTTTTVSNQGPGSYTNTYNNRGDLLSVTDPLGRTTNYAYTDRGQLRQITAPDPDGAGGDPPSVTTLAYDLAGNQTTVTDPLNRTTTTVYDAQNRVKEVQLPTISAGTPKTIYGYDLAGQLASISDTVNTTSYVYDDAGRVKQVNHPAGGSMQYKYNKNDEVTRMIDRLGRKRDFTYNVLGLPTTEVWRNSDETLVRTMTWTYDDAGRVVTAQDPDSKYTYSYNVADEVVKVDNAATPGVPNVVLDYQYDFAGNRTLLTDNLNHSISYVYADHRLDTMSLMAGGATVATVDFDYDTIGRVDKIKRIAGTEPVIQTAFIYDGMDRVKQIKHTRETGPPVLLSEFNYTYDVASQITQYVGPEGTLNYTYDNTGQLTGVSGARTESYSFDINGNRTMTGYSTGSGNRLSSDGTYNYTYDAEGNLVLRARPDGSDRTEYTWDHLNRLTQVVARNSAGGPITKQQDNTYDVNDRRIGVLEDADGSGLGLALRRWTVYDGANPYADFDAAGGLTKRYLYGPAMDQVFARIGAGEDVDWYVTDYLGSVRQIIDTNGTVMDALNYDSFGKILTETNPTTGDRFKFTAREWDALFGQYNYRARYYGPDIGRFRGEDPIGFSGEDANLYRYAGNSPTNATDPSGLITIYFDGTGQGPGSGTIIDDMFNATMGEKHIFRFPNWLQTGISNEVQEAFNRIVAAVRRNPNEPIYIIGWSRGAVAAVLLATALEEAGLRVDYLGIIDPVGEGIQRRSYVRIYPNWREILRRPRDLGELPRMTAAIPVCVNAGDVLYTPPTGGPYPSRVDWYMDQNNRVRLRPYNFQIRIAQYPGIGHAQGGFDQKVGHDLYQRALDAGVPLRRPNPFTAPPPPNRFWSDP